MFISTSFFKCSPETVMMSVHWKHAWVPQPWSERVFLHWAGLTVKSDQPEVKTASTPSQQNILLNVLRTLTCTLAVGGDRSFECPVLISPGRF